MSSNIKVKRVCKHCNSVFTARTTRTRFCSHKCNQRFYKAQLLQQKLEHSHQETEQAISKINANSAETQIPKLLINVKELSAMTSLSQRTLFRVMKDEGFPKMKVGKRLLFNKEAVINYLNFKYGCL